MTLSFVSSPARTLIRLLALLAVLLWLGWFAPVGARLIQTALADDEKATLQSKSNEEDDEDDEDDDSASGDGSKSTGSSSGNTKDTASSGDSKDDTSATGESADSKDTGDSTASSDTADSKDPASEAEEPAEEQGAPAEDELPADPEAEVGADQAAEGLPTVGEAKVLGEKFVASAAGTLSPGSLPLTGSDVGDALVAAGMFLALGAAIRAEGQRRSKSARA